MSRVLINVDNSTIEPNKNRGLGKQKKSILYNIINCHMHGYRTNTEREAWVTTLFKEKSLFLTFSVMVANPKKTTFSPGGQSRSWSADQGKRTKAKVWQRTPPRCAFFCEYPPNVFFTLHCLADWASTIYYNFVSQSIYCASLGRHPTEGGCAGGG